ncbi:MarR family transcriptional regulator [Vibrio splendidus]|uniref:MarR family transcriptional regulator n=1 Tax=Vibrio splendidus TaxID=29497 RepID=UPI000C847DEE|nr:helix-turn-helix domain-containing protein [Vibrio splendidus]PMP42498.1 hypothetical protein BCS86_14170 [Vibrio splendidus]
MKSQDFGVLLKLICLKSRRDGVYSHYNEDWEDWNLDELDEIVDPEADYFSIDQVVDTEYSARSLEKSLGISKTQVNISFKRCESLGLIRRERSTGHPIVNTKVLFNIIEHAIRYIFPITSGQLTRGIATSFGAPVLSSSLMTGGELIPVWSDSKGSTKGFMVEPLFKGVTIAVRKDPQMYAMLALIDAIRLGQPRERKLALEKLKVLFNI